MKCAKLRLQERSKGKSIAAGISDKPRRYCQKRLVDPEHDEDPRWMDLERFHCNGSLDREYNAEICENNRTPNEDYLFLSVQNLKFQGDTQHRKRPRTSFKYKSLSDNKKHRMFVKQVVNDINVDDDRSSELTCYYFEDYVKYIISDRSRPSSSKSSLFLRGISSNYKENKGVQVDTKQMEDKKIHKGKNSNVKTVKRDVKIQDSLPDTNMDDAKISFHKCGKRKSLTISRAPSPETVQVIRVDVVCNYNNGSIISDCHEDNKNQNKMNNTKTDKIDNVNLKNSHFANKYLLTNTVKTLDENVSGGAKVTLLCKTFKLTDRSKRSSESKHTKTTKDASGGKNRK